MINLINLYDFLLFRKAKEEARSAMFLSPALDVETYNRDPIWTPGRWRESNVGSSSDDESSDEKDNDVLKIYNEAMTYIASLTGRKVEPLTFRLATEWEKAAANEKAVCLDQVDEACRAACNVIAPRDSEKLLQAFQDSKTTEVCSDDLTSLITAYKHAPTRNLKTQILSIYAPRYSARFLKKMHEPFEKLSDRQIKKARTHAKNVGRSTLYRILQVREASQRRSLQGLDNIAASGAEGFDTMHKIVDELEEGGATAKWCEGVRTNLKDTKRYLKTEYRMHCEEVGSPCPDHCTCFALSDPKNPEFQGTCLHEHHARCASCESLKSVIQSVENEIESPFITLDSEDKKEDLKHDHNQAKEMIFQWKSHIIRAENQERAKQNVLKTLQSNATQIQRKAV